MAPHTPSAATMSLAGEPEQLPVRPLPDLADSSAVMQADGRRRPLEVAQCSLCGLALPLGLLVPDGGDACADIRWYCKDAKSCTERWTTSRPPIRAHLPAAPGHAFAGAGEPSPAGGSAGQPGGTPEHAPSVT